MERRYGALENDDGLDLTVFATKKPVWNDELRAWTLNFNGRAGRRRESIFCKVG